MGEQVTYSREELVEDTRYAAETLESALGVPPSQSPNGPRDKLTTELPNTGLSLSISFRHHVFLPGTDGTELRRDKRLTAERFEQIGRIADAGVVPAVGGANN